MTTVVINRETINTIIKKHAAAAAVAAMAGGVLPGIAALVSCGIAVSAIWTMYVRIAKELGMKNVSAGVWKTIASAMLSNIVTQLAGLLALELACSFLPGASIIACGVVNYGVTYVAGQLFLTTLTKLFKAGVNLESMTAAEIKHAMDSAAKDMDMNAVFKQSKAEFKQMRANGSLEQLGQDVDIHDEAK